MNVKKQYLTSGHAVTDGMDAVAMSHQTDAITATMRLGVAVTKGEQVRCEKCARRRMCSQTMEIFGRIYKVDFCSLGEGEERKDAKHNRQKSDT